MAGGRYEEVIRTTVEIAYRLTVDLGIGEETGEIVPRRVASLICQVLEILKEAANRAGCVFLSILVHVGIGTAEMLLCQPKHQRLVFRRDAKDHHDHPEGIPHRDIASEVAFGALCGQPVYEFRS